MNTKQYLKALVALANELGYKYKRHAKHGDIYVNNTNHSVINIGGSPSDRNFHKAVIRDIRKGMSMTAEEVPYL